MDVYSGWFYAIQIIESGRKPPSLTIARGSSGQSGPERPYYRQFGRAGSRGGSPVIRREEGLLKVLGKAVKS